MSEEEDSEKVPSAEVELPRKFTPAERIEELNDIDKVPFIPRKVPQPSLTKTSVHIRPPRLRCLCDDSPC